MIKSYLLLEKFKLDHSKKRSQVENEKYKISSFIYGAYENKTIDRLYQK